MSATPLPPVQAVPTPHRVASGCVVIARPSDGQVVVLRGATALVWSWAAGKIGEGELRRMLVEPAGIAGDLNAGIEKIVIALAEEGLVVDDR